MTEQEKIIFLQNAIYEMFDRQIVITKDMNLVDDLRLDSLDIVEIQFYYEEKTNQLIPDTVEQLITVSDLLNIMP